MKCYCVVVDYGSGSAPIIYKADSLEHAIASKAALDKRKPISAHVGVLVGRVPSNQLERKKVQQ